MGWKDWPYWLRGGLIGVLVLGIFALVLIPFGRTSGFFKFPYWIFPFFIVLVPTMLFSENLYKIIFYPNYLFFIIPTLIYFICGAIIGWIYGKIKGRGNASLSVSKKVKKAQ